jgi:hypothetical protein
MSDFTSAGDQTGKFLGGILNPLFGASTTTTTQTGAPAQITPYATQTSNTTKYLIVFVVVIVLGATAYLLTKNKKTA